MLATDMMTLAAAGRIEKTYSLVLPPPRLGPAHPVGVEPRDAADWLESILTAWSSLATGDAPIGDDPSAVPYRADEITDAIYGWGPGVAGRDGVQIVDPLEMILAWADGVRADAAKAESNPAKSEAYIETTTVTRSTRVGATGRIIAGRCERKLVLSWAGSWTAGRWVEMTLREMAHGDYAVAIEWDSGTGQPSRFLAGAIGGLLEAQS